MDTSQMFNVAGYFITIIRSVLSDMKVVIRRFGDLVSDTMNLATIPGKISRIAQSSWQSLASVRIPGIQFPTVRFGDLVSDTMNPATIPGKISRIAQPSSQSVASVRIPGVQLPTVKGASMK